MYPSAGTRMVWASRKLTVGLTSPLLTEDEPTRLSWLAPSPSRRSALSLSTRVGELTLNGGWEDGVCSDSALAPAAVLLLVTRSCGPLLVPVSSEVWPTELVWPRLKI